MKNVLHIGVAFLLTVVLYLCFGATAYADDIAINETNFPDAVFREYVTGFDKDGNGILSDAERANGQYMSLSNKGISSLQGIEFFAALRSLNCSNNQLTSLDVSRNTSLTNLECGYNQLTSLDVSGNTSLTSLYCYSNRLSSLNVSGSTSLTSLYCYGNRLSSLNVSDNTSLTSLRCYSNRLTSLNISGNTSLTFLNCSNNQLSSIDISGDTSLTDLDCRSNQLTSLNVTHNTSLTRLVCYSNQLTKLDVSRNTSLTGLSCDRNQLTSLDVSRNTSLTSLSCDNNQLTSLDVSRNSALTSLSCGSNQLTLLDISYCPDLVWMVQNLEPETIGGWVRYRIGNDNLTYDQGVTLITTHTPDLILPTSLTTIDTEAFSGGAFTYVLVPAGVEVIGSGAFAECPNLRYVELLGAETEIDDAAFDGVTGLTIIAPADSKAETWAAQHSVNFQPAA